MACSRGGRRWRASNGGLGTLCRRLWAFRFLRPYRCLIPFPFPVPFSVALLSVMVLMGLLDGSASSPSSSEVEVEKKEGDEEECIPCSQFSSDGWISIAHRCQWLKSLSSA